MLDKGIHYGLYFSLVEQTLREKNGYGQCAIIDFNYSLVLQLKIDKIFLFLFFILYAKPQIWQ